MQFIAILLWGAMSDFIINDLSSNHKYRTELPNIIYEIGLTPNLIGVYSALKRAAGDNGQCTKSEKTLSKQLNITKKTLHGLITQLCEVNPILKKSLVNCTNRFSECGDKDTNSITITDIWPENYSYFSGDSGGRVKNTPPRVKITQPRVNSTQGVGEKLPQGRVKITHKEEPFKKNIHEEEQQQSVVVFSCLEKINENEVSRDEKIKITKKYHGSEQTVNDAVNSVLAESFEPRETLLKSLRAALRDEWKSTAAQPQDTDLNRKLAQTVDMKTINLNSFMASKDVLEISRGNFVDTVAYAMPKEKFLQEVAAKSRTEVRKIFQGVG